MVTILVAGAVSFIISLIGTRWLIRFLVKKNYGQFIRQDGPTAHYTKRGTPTMGGVVIILATLVGYGIANLVTTRMPNPSGLLVLFLMVGMGVVGFFDDYIKIHRQRSLGLKPRWKFIGQGIIGLIFSILALQFPNAQGWTPGSTRISLTRDSLLSLDFAGPLIGMVLFVLWANFLITAWTNAVNLTDGLDGLATGVSAMVFAAYAILAFWQIDHLCGSGGTEHCYVVRDPRDVAIVAAAVTGACLGFLWWNASPAKIFMGDTGSLALGGTFAGLSIVTHTEILAVVIGGLFVIEVLSDVIQIGSFKLTGKRVFKMAPLHHHFEMKGWGEVTIVIRFWLVAILFVGLGLGLFYGEWAVQLL